MSDPPASDAPLTRRALRSGETGPLRGDVEPAALRGAGGAIAVDDAADHAADDAVNDETADAAAPPFSTVVGDDSRRVDSAVGTDLDGTGVPASLTAAEPARPVALAWLADDDVLTAPEAAASLLTTGGVATTGAVSFTGVDPVAPPLVEEWPRRHPLRPSVLLPTAIVLGLVAVYCVAMLLWPLYAVLPKIETVTMQSAAAPAAAPGWPAEGSAAVGVTGIGGPVANAVDPRPMASITKVVTALVVLDAMPLAVGEQGPEFAFTSRDRQIYRDTLADGESALNVPVGGTLTEYQLLQGMLIGSAGNYADRLASELYPSDRVYAAAAMEWLTAHGIAGITIVDPSGIDEGNTATPAALIALAQRAMVDPVIAEIVATASVELPGAGLVENTNDLLGDPGVVGVKTGTLGSDFNLLAGQDITVGETVVRVYATVLGQPDSDTRFAATRALLTELGAALQPATALPQGTVAGRVTTLWAEPVDIVTDADANIILWNSAAGSTSPAFDLGDARASGAEVGTVAVRGPLDTAIVSARLAADVTDPSPWWRLTHPLELFGLIDPAG